MAIILDAYMHLNIPHISPPYTLPQIENSSAISHLCEHMFTVYPMFEDMLTTCFGHVYTRFEDILIPYLKTCLHYV